MNKRGSIATFERKKDAKRAGYTISLKPQEAQELLRLKRSERREAFKRMRTR